MKTILVFFGGCSPEYPVSLQSAHAVLTHLDPARWRAEMVGITREGRWLHYTGPLERIPADRWAGADCAPCALLPDRGSRQLLLLDGSGRRVGFDAAFPVLHGQNGEDGTLQGLLELAGAPVIGCGALAGALCMDKDRAHRLAARAGVETPRGRVFPVGAPAGQVEEAARELGYPLFVKPVRAGSSFGITRVTGRGQLPAALAAAWAVDREALLEENIAGRELGCAVLGRDGELTVGLVDEVELAGGFFDYEEKYTLKTAALHCPARIPEETARRAREAACRIYRALGCKGFARVDLFLTPEGRLLFNEVNTIPGFTAHSRYPTMMRGIGLEFGPLLDRLIEAEVGA